MEKNWPRAVDIVLAWEGGKAIRPNEPGGAVNMGVSLESWREEHPSASVQDLMNITKDQAKDFYARRYWKAVGADEAMSGYDLCLFNAAVMQGVGGAKRLSGEARGDIGTFMFLHLSKKMDQIAHDAGNAKFANGWNARLKAIEETARELEE